MYGKRNYLIKSVKKLAQLNLMTLVSKPNVNSVVRMS